MRIMMAIPSLERGGAESQFVRLANGLRRRGHRVCVVALGAGGPLEAELEGPAPVLLGKASRLDLPATLARLAALALRERPELYYGFLPLPNILGAALRTLRPGLRLAFGLRASDTNLADCGPAARIITGLETAASALAHLVVCNSGAGRAQALARGMAARKLRVVRNGIDTARFRPDRAQGLALRRAWGVPESAPLVGLAARLDPVKDHPGFLRAAALAAQARTDLRFVCVGGGPEGYAGELRAQACGLGLGDRLAWAGSLADMPGAYNALDLLCLSSSCGEGFPNVLGEAMACGIPCASTDVGDAALVVGSAGAVAPRRDPAALAGAMLGLLARLEREGQALGRACRERVEAEFSLERMVAGTEELLLGLLQGRG